jgi:hypothetical protein
MVMGKKAGRYKQETARAREVKRAKGEPTSKNNHEHIMADRYANTSANQALEGDAFYLSRSNFKGGRSVP